MTQQPSAPRPPQDAPTPPELITSTEPTAMAQAVTLARASVAEHPHLAGAHHNVLLRLLHAGGFDLWTPEHVTVLSDGKLQLLHQGQAWVTPMPERPVERAAMLRPSTLPWQLQTDGQRFVFGAVRDGRTEALSFDLSDDHAPEYLELVLNFRSWQRQQVERRFHTALAIQEARNTMLTEARRVVAEVQAEYGIATPEQAARAAHRMGLITEDVYALLRDASGEAALQAQRQLRAAPASQNSGFATAPLPSNTKSPKLGATTVISAPVSAPPSTPVRAAAPDPQAAAPTSAQPAAPARERSTPAPKAAAQPTEEPGARAPRAVRGKGLQPAHNMRFTGKSNELRMQVQLNKDQHWVILKGSHLRKDTRENANEVLRDSLNRWKAEALKSGLLKLEGDHYLTTRDVEISSISFAGSLLTGRTSNGWQLFRNAERKTAGDAMNRTPTKRASRGTRSAGTAPSGATKSRKTGK